MTGEIVIKLTSPDFPEIEAEAIVRHQRALLGDMLAKGIAQGRVDEVRRGVVGADPVMHDATRVHS